MRFTTDQEERNAFSEAGREKTRHLCRGNEIEFNRTHRRTRRLGQNSKVPQVIEQYYTPLRCSSFFFRHVNDYTSANIVRANENAAAGVTATNKFLSIHFRGHMNDATCGRCVQGVPG